MDGCIYMFWKFQKITNSAGALPAMPFYFIRCQSRYLFLKSVKCACLNGSFFPNL